MGGANRDLAIDLFTDWYWEQDAELRFTRFEGRMAEISGQRPTEAIGLRRWELPGIAPLSGSWDEHCAALEARQPFREFEYSRLQDDGQLHYVSVSGDPMFDAAGKFTGYRGVSSDITQRKRAEEALRRAELHYRSLFENAVDGMFRMDDTGRVTMANLALARILGYESTEALLTGVRSVAKEIYVEPEDRARYRSLLLELGTVSAFEARWRRRDGTFIWVSINGRMVRDPGGGHYYLGSVSDITARKREQRLLALEHSVARLLGEARPADEVLVAVMEAVARSEGWECARYFEVDEAAGAIRLRHSWDDGTAPMRAFTDGSREMALRKGEGLAGTVWATGESLWVPDVTRDPRVAMRQLAARSGMHGAIVVPVKVERRVVGVLSISSASIREPDLRLSRALEMVCSQISQFLQRKQAEQVVRDSESRFRSLTELSSDFYWESDAEHRVSRMTHGGRHRTILGSGLIGVRRWDLPSTQPGPRGWAAHRADMEARRAFRDFEFGRLDAEGNERHLSISGAPAFDEQGAFLGYRGIGKDITARKREERMLALEHAIARILAEADSGPAALRAVMGEVCGTEGWDSGRWFRLDEVAGVMRLAESWASSPEMERYVEASRSFVVHPGQGLVGYVWEKNESLWLADAVSDPRLRMREVAEAAGLRGAFVLPVSIGGRVAGVLSFMSRRVREPDARLRQCLDMVASQLGQFLQRMQSEERRARHLRYQALLARFAEATVGNRDESDLIADVTRTVRDALGDVAVDLQAGEDGAVRILTAPEASGAEEARFLEAAASVLSAGLKRIQSESRLAYLAQFDALTGLPNRALLRDRFEQMIVRARRHDALLCVLFIDLDHFKHVNDTLGHAGGDALLREVSERLQAVVRSGDTVARISGDEFAVLLGDLAHVEDAAIVAQKILDALSAPVNVLGKEVFVSASVGIAAFPADGADADVLLRAADAAMYRAKQAGRNTYQYFTPEIEQRTRARAQLGSDLRRALERGEFHLAYQPKFDLRTGLPSGGEALLRWRRADGVVVGPDQFVPVLEETGLIVAVGEWVLRQVCEDLRAWKYAGIEAVPIAVNLSSRQFRQQTLDRDILSLLKGCGVSPSLVELEITESQLMHDPEHAQRMLRALSGAGIGIAIDDFGTGYSSLSYLTRFPVSALKIDRSFVPDVLSDHADAAIVRMVIDMAHTLGLTVVAEGVENGGQATFLRGLGCEQAQGFLFSRPLPAADFAALIAG